jgi:hypothetical protein
MMAGKRNVFFSEEKKQKTFVMLSRSYQAAQTPEFAKVFCFFSSEKKALPSVPAAGARIFLTAFLEFGTNLSLGKQASAGGCAWRGACGVRWAC